MKPCVCGHSEEQHWEARRGGMCSQCDCLAYEADETDEPEPEVVFD